MGSIYNGIYRRYFADQFQILLANKINLIFSQYAILKKISPVVFGTQIFSKHNLFIVKKNRKIVVDHALIYYIIALFPSNPPFGYTYLRHPMSKEGLCVCHKQATK